MFPWREDWEAFRRRVEEGVGLFRGLLGHEWLARVLAGGRVRVLDAMGGTGVGGVALALALAERGVGVDLAVLDLRRGALEAARAYSRRLLGFEARTVEAGVEDIPDAAGCPYDVILVYGRSTPHLDPYSLVRAAAGMASCLSGDGVVVVDEADRVYGVCYRSGYREVLVEEAGPDRLVVSYHAGYDPRRGVFRRVVVDHYTGESAVGEVRLWDIAGIAGVLWAFFEDVDFHPTRGATSGFILARGPRPVDPKAYHAPPRIASRQPRS